MAINFPNNPIVGERIKLGLSYYKWNGVAWSPETNVKFPAFIEYVDIVNQTANTVSIEPDKYNYFKIDLDADANITLPNATFNTSFVLELNRDFQGDVNNIDGAVYDNIFFDFGSQDSSPNGFYFREDGLKLYMIGDTTNSVYQYTLTTPWDFNTISYDSISFSVASQDTIPRGIFFKPDGTKMYIVSDNTNSVYQYTLTSPWELNAAVYDNSSAQSVSGTPYDIHFKTDGTKMYIIDRSSRVLYQYTLTSPWELNAAVYDNVSLNFADTSVISSSPAISSTTGVAFSRGGNYLYIVDDSSSGGLVNKVFQLTLSIPWDISTAIYNNIFFIVPQSNSPFDASIKPDGRKLYVLDGGNDNIYSYSIGTGPTVSPTITWSDNILWENGSAPTIDYDYKSTTIFQFLTLNGIDWIGREILFELTGV